MPRRDAPRFTSSAVVVGELNAVVVAADCVSGEQENSACGVLDHKPAVRRGCLGLHASDRAWRRTGDVLDHSDLHWELFPPRSIVMQGSGGPNRTKTDRSV